MAASSSRVDEAEQCDAATTAMGNILAGIFLLAIGEVEGPWLYMGDSRAASNQHKELATYGVTDVVNCTPDVPQYFDDSAAASWDASSKVIRPERAPRYHRIALDEMEATGAPERLLEAAAFIERLHAERPDAVLLVHSFHGINRAPSVLAAWLVLHRGVSLFDALARLKAKRPQVQPNASYLAMLQLIELRTRGQLSTGCDELRDVVEQQVRSFKIKLGALARLPNRVFAADVVARLHAQLRAYTEALALLHAALDQLAAALPDQWIADASAKVVEYEQSCHQLLSSFAVAPA